MRPRSQRGGRRPRPSPAPPSPPPPVPLPPAPLPVPGPATFAAPELTSLPSRATSDARIGDGVGRSGRGATSGVARDWRLGGEAAPSSSGAPWRALSSSAVGGGGG